MTQSNDALDANGNLRADLADLNQILDHVDEAEGRNDAIRNFIFALRDLQHAHDRFATVGDVSLAEVELAEACVREAFRWLVHCQTALSAAA